MRDQRQISPRKARLLSVCEKQKFKDGNLSKPKKKKSGNLSIDSCVNLAKSLTGFGKDRKCAIVFAWWDLAEEGQCKANWP